MQTPSESNLGFVWQPRPAISPCVVTASYYTRQGWRSASGCQPPNWVLDYSRSDCGRVRVGSPRVPWLERGSRVAHLYSPGTPYWENAADIKWVRGAFVVFTGGAEVGLTALTGAEGYARILDPGGRLEPALQAMAAAGHEMGELGFWRAQSAFCTQVHILLQARHRSGDLWELPSAAAVTPDFVQQAQLFMRANISKRIGVADIAAGLHMSPSSFAHRYRETTGEAPFATLTHIRIVLARSLILRGLRLDAVARECGFCDAYHLSKSFKRATGMSPREYIASVRPALG
jgi:AraC-like DNA-binding protein